MEKKLKYYWTESPVAFTSPSRVEQYLRQHDPTFIPSWREYVKRSIPLNVYAPHHVNYKQHLAPTTVPLPQNDYQWQMDLIDLSKQPLALKRQNKMNTYILVAIDVLTRYVVAAIPMKKKSAEEVARVLERIYQQAAPQLLQVDRGKEFYNKEVEKINRKFNVRMFSSYSNYKAALVERFNRTLKERLQHAQVYYKTNVWIDLLNDVVQQYNNTKHGAFDYQWSPSEARGNPWRAYEYQERRLQESTSRSSSFRVGDMVRIHKSRFIFTKGSTAKNWSDEVFIIRQALPGDYYKLKDFPLADGSSEDIEGRFYAKELKRAYVDEHTEYPIEKIIKHTGDQALVKFEGWPSKYNSWVPWKKASVKSS